MGFSLDAIASYEFSVPVDADATEPFALTAQVLLSPADGPPAFRSLEDVPLTQGMYMRVREAAPVGLATEMQEIVTKRLSFYLGDGSTETEAWQETLTNPSTGGLADLLRFRNRDLLAAATPEVEFVQSEVFDMEGRHPDGRAAVHARLRHKDYDTAHYEDRGWHLYDKWPWYGLEVYEFSAKEANAEARSLKIPLKAKDRRWSEARRAREAAMLQHVAARLGLVATDSPAWRLVLDVSGG